MASKQKKYYHFKAVYFNVKRNFLGNNMPVLNHVNVNLFLLKKRRQYLQLMQHKLLANLALVSFKNTVLLFLQKQLNCKINLYFFILPFTLRPAALVGLFIVFKLLKKYTIRFVINTVVSALQRCNSIQGINIKCSGRFTRKQRAVNILVKSIEKQNRPLNTFTAFIDYSFRSVKLTNSLCGIKL